VAPYQAIFMDWQMPGLDGWETAMRIRQMYPAGVAPIVIMVTAHGREMLSQRTDEEQAQLSGFLAKPITAPMLLEAAAQAMAGGGNVRPPSIAKAQRERQLVGMRLLVVEDNMINQQVAEELLNSQGALVSLAANGQLGVEAVMSAKPQFDAVLMDLQMPVMDGYAATKVIREQLGLTTLPIIAMTANAMNSDRDACLAAGMDDHVGKPFDLANMVAILVKLTGWSEAKRQLSADRPAAPQTHAQAELEGLGSDEFDVKGALDRMGSSLDLYLKVLKSFVKDSAGMAAQLSGHLSRGERLESVRLLHTLKGLAATVGARNLAKFATQAETTVRSGDIPGGAAQLVAQMQQEIEDGAKTMVALIKQLEQVAAKSAVSDKNQEGVSGAVTASAAQDAVQNRAQRVSELQKLHALLIKSDMDAMRAHAEFSENFGDSMGEALVLLDEAMANLDFEKAALECERLLQRIRT
jgi:CheY-like chemotaxis protein